MARQHQRAHSVSKRFFIQSIFERRGLVESHLSIAPREGIDFFAKRDENHLLSPVEIRIDETMQVARERWKDKSHYLYVGSVAVDDPKQSLFSQSSNGRGLALSCMITP
jgi:hypothetical protein